MSRKLTGKIRYRQCNPVFGKPVLVLQVEVECGGDYDPHDGMSSPEFLRFLDARVEDLTELKMADLNKEKEND